MYVQGRPGLGLFKLLASWLVGWPAGTPTWSGAHRRRPRKTAKGTNYILTNRINLSICCGIEEIKIRRGADSSSPKFTCCCG
ncbi:uncharacterized protein BKA78DRAFT_310119 [Phyllosticta capitalensis]|uniref:uncharacterized protein n=1 Tax=Phyllosticta capitalensis TaxID=121624 RepID=UPI00312F6A55